MNAVILYDEYQVGSKANAMLCEAAYRADAGLPWNINCCPMDMLTRWPTADDALHDAVSAHLIVIAVRHQAELPPRLLKWLEIWAEHRQIHGAALAVFDGTNGDACFSPPSPALVLFATRHGLCFIFGDANPDEDEAAAFLNPYHEACLETIWERKDEESGMAACRTRS